MFEYWVLFADQGLIIVQSVYVLTAELGVLNFCMDGTGSIPLIDGWPVICTQDKSLKKEELKLP